jgi:hypothetical protein
MSSFDQRIRRIVDPASTAITRCWCDSSLRRVLRSPSVDQGQRRQAPVTGAPLPAGTATPARPGVR